MTEQPLLLPRGGAVLKQVVEAAQQMADVAEGVATGRIAAVPLRQRGIMQPGKDLVGEITVSG